MTAIAKQAKHILQQKNDVAGKNLPYVTLIRVLDVALIMVPDVPFKRAVDDSYIRKNLFILSN